MSLEKEVSSTASNTCPRGEMALSVVSVAVAVVVAVVAVAVAAAVVA